MDNYTVEVRIKLISNQEDFIEESESFQKLSNDCLVEATGDALAYVLSNSGIPRKIAIIAQALETLGEHVEPLNFNEEIISTEDAFADAGRAFLKAIEKFDSNK